MTLIKLDAQWCHKTPTITYSYFGLKNPLIGRRRCTILRHSGLERQENSHAQAHSAECALIVAVYFLLLCFIPARFFT